MCMNCDDRHSHDLLGRRAGNPHMCVNCDAGSVDTYTITYTWQPTHVRELRRQKRTEIVIHL